MKRILFFNLLLFISITCFSQSVENITGVSGSFVLTSAQYVNNLEKQYNINIGSQSNVQLNIVIDVEEDWDMLYIYECDNNFSNLIHVKTVTGNKSDSYVTISTNGRLVMKFISDAGTCGANGYNGFTVNYSTTTLSQQSIPATNNLSTTAGIEIGEETNSPNLHIIDRVSKNLGGLSQANDFSKSMILLESEYNSKLALTYNKISSSDAMEINSDETMLFNSKSHDIFTNYFSVSTPLKKDALVVEPSGKIKMHSTVMLDYNQWIGIGANQPYETGAVRLYMHSEGKHAYIDFKDNLNFRADKGSVSPIIIQGDGNVAIGYSTSYATDGTQYRTEGHKLAVNGSTLLKGDLTTEGIIKAEEILVEANGNTADFVFSDTYQLKDLTEVENFIKTNKHLPDIPSAETMEKQGVNLAEMNKLLLQKVEELMLYAIEKDKEVQELKLDREKECEIREKLEARMAKIEALLIKE